MHTMRANGRQDAFTLIELLIVVAVIGVLATIAVPNLLGARNVAAEPAILGALRAIVGAQAQSMSSAEIDLDGDSVGEGLSLAELAGTANLRGHGRPLVPPLLPPSLGAVDSDGHVLAHGYYFALFLCGAGGTGVSTAAATLAQADPNLSETYWTCLAWPARRSGSSDATWFVNQSGQILLSRTAPYLGKAAPPPAGAALLGVPASSIHTSQCANGQAGADGNVWIAVR